MTDSFARILALLNKKNIKGLEQDVSDIEQIVTSLSFFTYKGNIPSVSDLPSTAEIGDTYVIDDSLEKYTWDGTEWQLTGKDSIRRYLSDVNVPE